jgi:hypothetical protein
LDIECLHIVRTFKLFCRFTFGRLHPLAHANKGLTLCNILHYCHEQRHFIRLTIVVQDVLDFDFLRFPKLRQCHEDIIQCWQDLLGLLGFDLQLQNPIVEKTQQFMSKSTHIIISNLLCVKMAKELEDMLCNSNIGRDGKQILDQVFVSLPFHLLFFL